MAALARTLVRPATEADLETLLELTAAVAAEDRYLATEPGFDRSLRRERTLAALQAADAVSLVLCDGERIAGHIVLRPVWPGLLQLSMLVARGDRGRGFGTLLIEHALRWARTTDAHKVTLDVFAHNAAALGLYERFGFAREGLLRAHARRRNGQTWDVVPMGLLLRGPTP